MNEQPGRVGCPVSQVGGADFLAEPDAQPIVAPRIDNREPVAASGTLRQNRLLQAAARRRTERRRIRAEQQTHLANRGQRLHTAEQGATADPAAGAEAADRHDVAVAAAIGIEQAQGVVQVIGSCHAARLKNAVLVDIDPMNDAGRRLAVKGLELGQRADALRHPPQIAGFAALRLCGIANEGWQRAIDLGHRRRQLGQLFDEHPRHQIFRHGRSPFPDPMSKAQRQPIVIHTRALSSDSDNLMTILLTLNTGSQKNIHRRMPLY